MKCGGCATFWGVNPAWSALDSSCQIIIIMGLEIINNLPIGFPTNNIISLSSWFNSIFFVCSQNKMKFLRFWIVCIRVE